MAACRVFRTQHRAYMERRRTGNQIGSQPTRCTVRHWSVCAERPRLLKSVTIWRVKQPYKSTCPSSPVRVAKRPRKSTVRSITRRWPPHGGVIKRKTMPVSKRSPRNKLMRKLIGRGHNKWHRAYTNGLNYEERKKRKEQGHAIRLARRAKREQRLARSAAVMGVVSKVHQK